MPHRITFCNSTRLLDATPFAAAWAAAEQSGNSGSLFSEEELSLIYYGLQSLSASARVCLQVPAHDGLVALAEQTHRTVDVEPASGGDKYDCIISAGAPSAAMLERLKPNGFLFVRVTEADAPKLKAQLEDCNFTGISRFLSLLQARAPAPTADMDASVWAIIPVHNRMDHTRRCLQLLSAQTVAGRLRITVVDDGSTDGTGDMLAREFPDVEIVHGDGNLWWTGSVAAAIQQLRPRFGPDDFFLLINNDSLLAPETVETLLAEAVRDRAVAWAPLAMEAGRPIACAEAGHTLYHMHLMVAAMLQGQGRIPASALFGRCSLYPVEILDAVRNFDAETFPHYWGDSDFMLRARHKGYACRVTAESCITVYHTDETTGSHHQYFAGPRSMAEVIKCMTDTRSYFNVRYMWRYLKRHEPEGRRRRMLRHIFKIIRQHRLFQ